MKRLRAGLAWPCVSLCLWVYLPVFSISEHMFSHLTVIRRQTLSCFPQTDQHAQQASVPSGPGQSSSGGLGFGWAEQSLVKKTGLAQ